MTSSSEGELKFKISKLKKKNRRVLLVIAKPTEEWLRDINKLKNSSGSTTTDQEVCNLIHQQGYEPYAIIVKPNRLDEDNDFIEVCNLLSCTFCTLAKFRFVV